MLLDKECKSCLFNSQMKKVEAEQTDSVKLSEFKNGVKLLCENPPQNYCAPLLMRDINSLHCKIFGKGIDYSREKALFNGKLLALEDEIFATVQAAPDPLECALKFAMAANYIDFARLSDIGEEAVNYVLSAALKAEPRQKDFQLFRAELARATSLCYLHDNCGEIVLDKILIRTIKELYPQISITSVVRGAPIINDVTKADAAFIGLEKYAKVIDNGTNVPGTYLNEVSEPVKDVLRTSDIIISKGLGNLETLYGEGFLAYYCFTCKCEHIAKRFNSPLWSAVFVKEGAC